MWPKIPGSSKRAHVNKLFSLTKFGTLYRKLLLGIVVDSSGIAKPTCPVTLIEYIYI